MKNPKPRPSPFRFFRLPRLPILRTCAITLSSLAALGALPSAHAGSLSDSTNGWRSVSPRQEIKPSFEFLDRTARSQLVVCKRFRG